ncbi:MAG: hypothetical protein EOP15_11140, partial [Pseudomonas sp.]
MRQAEGVDQATAQVGVGEAEVAVSHCGSPVRQACKCGPSLCNGRSTGLKTPSLYGSNCFRRNNRMRSSRRVAILGGNRIPFARSNGAYA